MMKTVLRRPQPPFLLPIYWDAPIIKSVPSFDMLLATKSAHLLFLPCHVSIVYSFPNTIIFVGLGTEFERLIAPAEMLHQNWIWKKLNNLFSAPTTRSQIANFIMCHTLTIWPSDLRYNWLSHWKTSSLLHTIFSFTLGVKRTIMIQV